MIPQTRLGLVATAVDVIAAVAAVAGVVGGGVATVGLGATEVGVVEMTAVVATGATDEVSGTLEETEPL